MRPSTASCDSRLAATSRTCAARAGASTATSTCSHSTSGTAGCAPAGIRTRCPASGPPCAAAPPARCSPPRGPGWEFLDWGRSHHIGGGSHGALHANDSLGSLLWCGTGPDSVDARAQWTLRDIVPMILDHFSVDRHATARRLSCSAPPWALPALGPGAALRARSAAAPRRRPRAASRPPAAPDPAAVIPIGRGPRQAERASHRGWTCGCTSPDPALAGLVLRAAGKPDERRGRSRGLVDDPTAVSWRAGPASRSHGRWRAGSPGRSGGRRTAVGVGRAVLGSCAVRAPAVPAGPPRSGGPAGLRSRSRASTAVNPGLRAVGISAAAVPARAMLWIAPRRRATAPAAGAGPRTALVFGLASLLASGWR